MPMLLLRSYYVTHISIVFSDQKEWLRLKEEKIHVDICPMKLLDIFDRMHMVLVAIRHIMVTDE
jgi:hypothetical protein